MLQCIAIVNKLQQLKPTNEHYFILKALILLNSDVKLDDPQPLLERLRDSFLNRLTNSVIASYPHEALRVTQNMFLILPSLRQADQINRQFWTTVYWNRLVKIDQFLAEMLGIKFHSWSHTQAYISLSCTIEALSMSIEKLKSIFS